MTSKKPSNIIEVAELAGVSTMTVSRYFNQPDKLAKTTKTKVKNAVEQLGYVPNAAAVTLLKGRSKTLALILPDINNPFFTAITRGAEDVAQAHGYTMFIGNTDEDASKEKDYLESLVRRRVDGVVVAPSPSTNSNGLSHLANHNIPVVLVDCQIKKSPFDIVHGDSLQGGRILTQHLIEQGYKDIVFVGGPAGVSTLEQRLQGYREVMKQTGLEPRFYLGRYDEASGYEIALELHQKKKFPRTLIAANNRVAVGLMKALREKGLWHGDGVKRKEGVNIASFDNIDEYLFAIYKPFIAVVVQPAYEMGKRATEMLIERIEGFRGEARDVLLPVQLIT